MRARYYNPEIMRFINVDPIKDGWNWYEYAAGDPIGLFDPFGLSAENCTQGVNKWKKALLGVALLAMVILATGGVGGVLVVGKALLGTAAALGKATVVSALIAKKMIMLGAVVGATFGGFVGGLSGLISAGLRGQDIKSALMAGLAGAIGGAVGGAIVGAVGAGVPTSATMLKAVLIHCVSGAAGGASSSIVSQSMSHYFDNGTWDGLLSEMDWQKVRYSAAAGAVFNAALGGFIHSQTWAGTGDVFSTLEVIGLSAAFSLFTPHHAIEICALVYLELR